MRTGNPPLGNESQDEWELRTNPGSEREQSKTNTKTKTKQPYRNKQLQIFWRHILKQQQHDDYDLL